MPTPTVPSSRVSQQTPPGEATLPPTAKGRESCGCALSSHFPTRGRLHAARPRAGRHSHRPGFRAHSGLRPDSPGCEASLLQAPCPAGTSPRADDAGVPDPAHRIVSTHPAWIQACPGPATPNAGAASSGLAGLPASRQCGPSPRGRGGAPPALRPLCWSPPCRGRVRAGPSFRGLPLLLTS